MGREKFHEASDEFPNVERRIDAADEIFDAMSGHKIVDYYYQALAPVLLPEFYRIPDLPPDVTWIFQKLIDDTEYAKEYIAQLAALGEITEDALSTCLTVYRYREMQQY